MDNVLALAVVLTFTAALMVLAAVWFYILAALMLLYGVVRGAGIVAGWLRTRSTP